MKVIAILGAMLGLLLVVFVPEIIALFVENAACVGILVCVAFVISMINFMSKS